MKQAILFTVLVVSLAAANAQLNLREFNKERSTINKKGFLVLGSWSAANIASGIIGQSSASGQAKYFHQMNILWGSVNLLIALPGWLGASKSATDLSFAGSVKGQAGIEKIFIFNAGLDLAYIAGGAWFIERANRHTNPDKFKGYGKSILMQGGFLLLFDAMMFTTHNRHGKKLFRVLDGLQLAPNSVGFRVAM